jgi:hypothetical protein
MCLPGTLSALNLVRFKACPELGSQRCWDEIYRPWVQGRGFLREPELSKLTDGKGWQGNTFAESHPLWAHDCRGHLSFLLGLMGRVSARFRGVKFSL